MSPRPHRTGAFVALPSLYGDLKILSEQHILDRNSEGQAIARVRAKARGMPANVEGPERVQNAENREFGSIRVQRVHAEVFCFQ